jgi:hemoglobin
MTVYSETGIPLQGFNACGTRAFVGAGPVPRTADAKVDFVYPEVPFPTDALYRTWGEANIRAMVHHHHALLRKTVIGALFPAEDDAFALAGEKAADFFVEALGGGKHFSDTHGHPELRRRHLHILVDEKARDVWLMMYRKTIVDCEMPAEYAEPFWNWIEALSIRMINRRTTVEPIRRYPFGTPAEQHKAD